MRSNGQCIWYTRKQEYKSPERKRNTAKDEMKNSIKDEDIECDQS